MAVRNRSTLKITQPSQIVLYVPELEYREEFQSVKSLVGHLLSAEYLNGYRLFVWHGFALQTYPLTCHYKTVRH